MPATRTPVEIELAPDLLYKLGERIERRLRLVPGPLDSPCLIWGGAVNSAGYGIISVTLAPKVRAVVTIHRLRYCLLTRAAIPAGKVIGHKCDVKTCAAFDHLEVISYGANLRDAWARDRRLRPRSCTQPLLWTTS